MIESSVASSLASCSECRREFPADDLMPFGGVYICADCKPLFLQRLREGVPTPGSHEYGSIGFRFLAILIDGILLALVNHALSLALGIYAAPSARVRTASRGILVGAMYYTAATTLIAIAYYVGFIANGGATPGKMAMGLKVITAEGLPVSYGRALGRHFAQILDALTLGVGYLIAFSDDQRRTLHDRICGTRVIVVR